MWHDAAKRQPAGIQGERILSAIYRAVWIQSQDNRKNYTRLGHNIEPLHNWLLRRFSTKKLSIVGRAGLFSIEAGDDSDNLQDFFASIDYFFTKNIGIGLV